MTQATPSALPAWTSRRVMAATLVALAVLFGFWFLYHYYPVIFILFVALVIGTAVAPLVNGLQKLGVPVSLGTLLVYLLLLGLIVSFFWLLVPLIADQVAGMAIRLPEYYDSLRNFLLHSPSRLLWRLATQLPPTLSVATAPPPPSDTETVDTMAQVFIYVNLVGWSVFITIGVLLMAYFWTVEGPRATRVLLLMVPLTRRDEARDLVAASEEKVGAFIRGQIILCVTIGVMALIAYLLIGLPYALVLALIAGVMEAVPYLGPALGAVLPMLLALSSDDPTKAIWVLVATVVIQVLENNLLVPRVMDESVGVNPIFTLLAFAAFGSLLGMAGVFMAVPAAAIIQLLIDRYVLAPAVVEQEAPAGRDSVSVLRYETQALVQDLRKQIRSKEIVTDDVSDQIEEKIEAIAADLDSILAGAEEPAEATA